MVELVVLEALSELMERITTEPSVSEQHWMLVKLQTDEMESRAPQGRFMAILPIRNSKALV